MTENSLEFLTLYISCDLGTRKSRTRAGFLHFEEKDWQKFKKTLYISLSLVSTLIFIHTNTSI